MTNIEQNVPNISSFKEKWSDAWENASKKLKENNKKFKEAIKKLSENYKKQNEDIDSLIEVIKNGQESGSLKKYLLGTSVYDQYKTNEKYSTMRENISASNLSNTQKDAALNFIADNQDSESTTDGLIQDTMDTAVDSFSNGLQKMILGYQDFKTTMQQIGSELTTYLLKQITDLAIQSLFTVNNFKAAGNAASATGNWGGGFLGAVGGIFKGVFGKHHSGGVIPSGANYSLPGTQEQLALLKGGERVLSPSENVSYNDSQGGGSPVVLNNFNIKAWDSKDVRKYLTENRELLNQITFEGIKNNNCQLRNMVKGA